MRQNGTITSWNDEKGFGFIAPNDGTDDVFLHFRAVTDRARRPQTGDRVEYDLDHDDQRRPRAARASLQSGTHRPTLNPSRTRDRRHDSGVLRLILILLLPANVLGAVVLAARLGFVPPWVAFLYVGLSVVAAIAYALDKYRAQKGKWRIAEGTLQLFAMAGGWPGAFAAQRILRHKTRKLSFQITYWLIVASHLAFWSWVVKRQMEGWS